MGRHFALSSVMIWNNGLKVINERFLCINGAISGRVCVDMDSNQLSLCDLNRYYLGSVSFLTQTSGRTLIHHILAAQNVKTNQPASRVQHSQSCSLQMLQMYFEKSFCRTVCVCEREGGARSQFRFARQVSNIPGWGRMVAASE